MSITDQIRALVDAYINDYVLAAGLEYQLTVNSTYTAFNLKITGSITDSPILVQQAVLTGFQITKIVVPLGYIAHYNLADIVNPRINPPTGKASIDISFSYGNV